MNLNKIKFAFFDFDGTLSLLREGWKPIIIKYMAEQLAYPKKPSEKHIKGAHEYIEETTGIRTFLQMQWLESKVKHKTAKQYKREYLDRLEVIIKKRINEIKKLKNPEDYLVKGSKAFLNLLKEKNIDLFLFSGTDEKNVIEEAKMLGINHYFTDIYGDEGKIKDYSKETVIKLLIKKYKPKSKEFMIIGDGPVEIKLGKKYNALPIGILTKTNKDRIKQADIIVKDFDKLMREYVNS